jgi:hypothetical protein
LQDALDSPALRNARLEVLSISGVRVLDRYVKDETLITVASAIVSSQVTSTALGGGITRNLGINELVFELSSVAE